MIKYLIAMLLLAVPAVTFGQRIVTPELDRTLRSLVPDLEDEKLEKMLRTDPSVVYYTINEMPRAMQAGGSNGSVRLGFHRVDHNFSGDDDPTFHSSRRPHGEGGNANIDFPWRMDVPGGTHRCTNVTSFKAFLLPKQSDGRPWPIVWFHRNLENPISGAGFDKGYAWLFPKDTRFFEFIVQTSPEGHSYVFEVRERIRMSDYWDVEVYRPFPTLGSYIDGIKKLRPNWRDNQDLVDYLSAVKKSDVVGQTLTDKYLNRSKSAFSVTAGVSVMPDCKDNQLTYDLLVKSVWQASMGEVWDYGDHDAHAPSYEGDGFQIVPKGYDGTYLGTDANSCMNCHESTNTHARVFDRERGWYGYVSGSDGIISWHPCEPSSLGKGEVGRRAVWRRTFVEAGIWAQYDPAKHPAEMYTRIPSIK